MLNKINSEKGIPLQEIAIFLLNQRNTFAININLAVDVAVESSAFNIMTTRASHVWFIFTDGKIYFSDGCGHVQLNKDVVAPFGAVIG